MKLDIVKYDKASGVPEKLLFGSREEYADVDEAVSEIVNDVKKNGDAALFKYTEQFDNVKLDAGTVKVTPDEIAAAYGAVPEELLRVIRRAAARITDFHGRQRQNSWFETSERGEILGQLLRPLDICGVYVPGGQAAYPSSVLMNIIPAKIAGVNRIVMLTPPGSDGKVFPVTVVAAVEAGATEIYKAGGAHAIAAMAFGTESIPRVDKIVGPGNIYVATAKKNVYGQVNIDSIAGPSEILIIADDSANPVFVAADMLSQAEHTGGESSVLITTSQELAEKVNDELNVQLKKLSRGDIAEKSLTSYGVIIIVDNLGDAVELSNICAPEHLEICVAEPFALLPKVKNAGAVFLGHYTPEPLGDYMAGPNHILPTGGTARFFSPLSVDDFMKKTSILSFTREGFIGLAEDTMAFAKAEGLTAHANSVKVRMDEER